MMFSKINKEDWPRMRFFYWLGGLVNPMIIIGYGYITVLTPRMGTFDSAGTKFLALAIFNLAVLIYLQFRRDQQPPSRMFSTFFSNRIGLLYGLFLVVSLLSGFKASNLAEFIITMAKLLNVFTAVMIIAFILRINNRYLIPLSVAMSLLLLFEASNIFYQMWKMADKYPNFNELFKEFAWTYASGYLNKNIMAAALFVKLPFALWLWTYKKGVLKTLGLVAVFFGFIAILPMLSRAFYIGLVALTAAYLLFLIVRFMVDRIRLKTALYSLLILFLIPLFLYLGWLGLGAISPTIREFNLNDKIVGRFATTGKDVISGLRIASWGRSFQLIGEEPLLGVGAGNWKIAVMKYETRSAPDFIYYYYNHNDFIQTAAETGIVGGLLFLSLFIGVGWVFLRALIKKTGSGLSHELLFIPAFGLLCYSVDAFFNFPFDRAEIQSLWAIFLGAAIAFTPAWKTVRRFSIFDFRTGAKRSSAEPFTIYEPEQSGARRSHLRFSIFRFRFTIKKIVPVVYIILIVGSIYLLFLNFRSLQMQGLIKYELEKKELTAPSSYIMSGFPAIPNISVEGEPIAVLKARYLINEHKYNEAITLLKADHAHPWESRREYFISLAYESLGNYDSAIVYAMKVFRQKPFYIENVDNLCSILEGLEKYDEANSLLTEFFTYAGEDPKVYGHWRTELLWKRDIPGYINRQAEINRKAIIKRMEIYYIPAQYEYARKNYRAAAGHFTAIIEKEPGLIEAWEKRAWCYFYLNEPARCLADIDHVLGSGTKNPGLEELRKAVKK
jgi:O-antigen ligase/tetratricopeptide (TPR) repeat protein